jgi:hypothetical protein
MELLPLKLLFPVCLSTSSNYNLIHSCLKSQQTPECKHKDFKGEVLASNYSHNVIKFHCFSSRHTETTASIFRKINVARR